MFKYTFSPIMRTFEYDSSIDPHEDSIDITIQIDEDSYHGAYSDHSFTAWLGIRPSAIDAPDRECDEFWKIWKDKALYGGGETPQVAFLDLIAKIEVSDLHVICDDLLTVTLHLYEERKAFLYDSDEFRDWLKQ